ncbi:hypothetical protein PNOK_0833000 [Pyrrhoderma noxium]|uniref:DUF6534 domain-containing protein n=1 Tax=Pyrrhoderma noxium TaxID=2282107 RepID=A0A286UAW4_9AGAM|nr:hypothetical protein PNOK_0833000 [Pyrrhoderma noxium]
MSGIQDSFGSAYIGAMVMMILYGITCLQTYLYFMRYPGDLLTTKFLVGFLWILDTFHVVLVAQSMYHYLITNFSNPAVLDDGTWTIFVSIGLNVCIAFVVKCFFTQKIHGLSERNWFLTIPLTLVVVAHFAFGLETMGRLLVIKKFSRLPELNNTAALPFAIFAMVSDIAITCALIFLLQNRRTTFKSTNMLINYLIIYTINRCLLTSIIALVELIVFVSSPHTFWFLALDFVIGKCYVNSFLATLNTRSSLRGKGMDSEEGGTIFTSDLEIAPVTPSMLDDIRSQNGTTAKVTRISRLTRSSRSTVSRVDPTDISEEFKDTDIELETMQK